jgi:hypothetical protein
MIRRLLFVVFFALGGFVFYVPKWILMGTKGQRQRKQLIKQQQRTNELLQQRAK